VAERAGFVLEGVLRSESLTPSGEPRDTRVYARTQL
jgi:RimJ/RimL family protein N-acetyltransferase